MITRGMTHTERTALSPDLCPVADGCCCWGRRSTITLLHHAEALAHAPGKRFVEYEQPILEHGERIWRRFRDIDSEDGAFDYHAIVPEDREPFEAIACDMLKAGIGREGLVGAAQSYLFDATDIVRFGVEWIETKLLGDLASE